MARGKAHSDETRAEVIAALLAGMGVSDAAKKYSLPHQTVSRIKSELSSEMGEVGREKRNSIDQLLLDSVATHLAALDRIADYVSKPEYLQAKSPESLATLYKELRDTPLSILEAASNAGLDDEPDEIPD